MTDVDYLDLLAQELGFVLKSEQREALELLLRGKDFSVTYQQAYLSFSGRRNKHIFRVYPSTAELCFEILQFIRSARLFRLTPP